MKTFIFYENSDYFSAADQDARHLPVLAGLRDGLEADAARLVRALHREPAQLLVGSRLAQNLGGWSPNNTMKKYKFRCKFMKRHINLAKKYEKHKV